MSSFQRQILLLFMTAVTVVGGYAFLRYAFRVTDEMPFAQEIVLIILGTVATVLITALLLNKQTAVEIEKEQSVKFLDLKTRTYEELIGRIEEMSAKETVSERDLVRLQFTTHRLAIFASAPVLAEFEHFLGVLRSATHDRDISPEDDQAIARSLAMLTTKIRADLLGEVDRRDDDEFSEERINGIILGNSSASMALNAESEAATE